MTAPDPQTADRYTDPRKRAVVEALEEAGRRDSRWHGSIATDLLRRLDIGTQPNPVQGVGSAVGALDRALPDLIEAADDPEGAGLCMLLADVRAAREQLAQLEATLEREAGRALSEPRLAIEGRLRAERYRQRPRVEWRHDDWQRDVREKVLRTRSLLNATVFDSQGTELPASVLHDALAAAQKVHGSTQPRSTDLRGLGLDPSDYCHTEPGIWRVKTQLIDSQSEVTESESEPES